MHSVPTTAPPALLDALLDDAALFPPGEAPMAAAVSAHAAHARQWYADLVGPFVCPASRLAEHAVAFDAATVEMSGSVELAVVVDTGTGSLPGIVTGLPASPARRLVGVELPLRGVPLDAAARRAAYALRDALDGTDDVTCFVEVPREPGWEAALDVLAEEGLLAKLRTGGTTPAAFPSEAEVAAFLLACADRDLDLKCTAGLHSAVRRTNSTGVEEHGFLNLLLATAAAPDGAGAADVAEVLALRDPARVVEGVRALSADTALEVRRRFRSFGTCSVREPVEHLVALGLLLEGGPAA